LPGASPASLERLLAGLTAPGRYTVYAVPAGQALPADVQMPLGTRRVDFVAGTIFVLPGQAVVSSPFQSRQDAPVMSDGVMGRVGTQFLPEPTPAFEPLNPCAGLDLTILAADPDLCGNIGQILRRDLNQDHDVAAAPTFENFGSPSLLQPG
jgi:hypothetical protein